LGRAFRETDLAEADLNTIVRNMISGEYSDPLRVVAFNTVEGWSRDVSEEIARTLVGKVGSVFVSTATQHGGQETTITSFHSTLLHQGMIIVGLPYAFPGLTNMDEITGGSPYGASTLAKGDGSRQPSANELDGARYQGKHVAQITAKLTQNQ
jgi:NAD(P)H:quinone oxidoreductase type IV